MSDGGLEVAQEEQPVLEDKRLLRRVQDWQVVCMAPLLQLPQFFLGGFCCMGRQEVLEFLDYYVDVGVVPGLVERLVNVESEKCEVRVVTHQTSFPEYFDLEFCIPIN